MYRSDRVRELRNKRGLTQRELGAKMGKTYQQISHLENTDSTKANVLEMLADNLGTTTDYLLGRTDIADIPIYQPVSEEDRGVRIPIYGRIPAGRPIEALTVDYGYMVVDKSLVRGDREYLGLKVIGDSMYPFYMEGDTVLIQITPEVESGDDVIAFIGYDDEATLKRFHWKENGIELEPLNKKYKKRFFGRNDPEVRILGKVVEIRREV